MDEKDSILASIPTDMKEKGSILHTSLTDGKVISKEKDITHSFQKKICCTNFNFFILTLRQIYFN